MTFPKSEGWLRAIQASGGTFLSLQVDVKQGAGLSLKLTPPEGKEKDAKGLPWWLGVRIHLPVQDTGFNPQSGRSHASE